MQKIAIFDIDKTIIRRDSMFLFLQHGWRLHPSSLLGIPAVGWYTLLYALKRVPAEKVKSVYFRAIRYMDDADLERFYDDVLVRHLYKEALAEMKARRDEGCHVLLISASPMAYVRYFQKLAYVDGVIGTELAQRGGRYTNQIEGCNCKGEEKVSRLNRYLQEIGLQIDAERSYAYSDSISDMPLFSLVKHRYIVNGRYPGLEERRWKG